MGLVNVNWLFLQDAGSGLTVVWLFGRICHRITVFRPGRRISLEKSGWISQRQSQSYKKTDVHANPRVRNEKKEVLKQAVLKKAIERALKKLAPAPGWKPSGTPAKRKLDGQDW